MTCLSWHHAAARGPVAPAVTEQVIDSSSKRARVTETCKNWCRRTAGPPQWKPVWRKTGCAWHAHTLSAGGGWHGGCSDVALIPFVRPLELVEKVSTMPPTRRHTVAPVVGNNFRTVKVCAKKWHSCVERDEEVKREAEWRGFLLLLLLFLK